MPLTGDENGRRAASRVLSTRSPHCTCSVGTTIERPETNTATGPYAVGLESDNLLRWSGLIHVPHVQPALWKKL